MFDIREDQIIQELINNNKKINSKSLTNQLNISSRQLTYSLSKINEELVNQNLQPIKRNQKGEWSIEKNSRSWLASQRDSIFDIKKQESSQDVVEADYRAILITIFILVYPDVIRIKNIEEHFFVSRNTIISDLKKVKSLLEIMELSLKYTPLNGYFISGDEENIKRQIVLIVNKLMRIETKISILDTLIVDIREQVIHLISSFEKELNLKYSDTSFTTLFYTVSLSSLYFKKSKMVPKITKNKFEETEEYQFLVENIFDIGLSYRNNADIEWYTLLFLSSNTILNQLSPEDTDLYFSIKKLISIFEQKTSIKIKESNYLAKRLFLHLRPAIYRIKFDIPIEDIDIDISEMEKIEYKAIFNILTDSMDPIEKIVEKKVPINEIKLISFYFGGELLDQKTQITETKKRAIVVCSNGLIVAKLMLTSLTELFPELNFITSASVRDFYKFEKDYEIVFSTIPLQTSVTEYVVKPILSEKDKAHLRINVLRDLMMGDIHRETEEILNIIKKNSPITNEHVIYSEISAYLANLKATVTQSDNLSEENKNLPLSYYLKEEYITISHDHFSNWQEALDKACEPLLKEKTITRHYVSRLKKQLSDPNSYFFLNEKIAIPHSIPEDGVNKEACALLISTEPITFPGNHKINFIMPFALLNSKNYLYALNQVISLSEDEILQQEFLNSSDSNEVFNKIKNLNT